MSGITNLEANYDDAVSFAASYYRELPRHITVIYEGKPPITQTFQPAQDEALHAFVQEHNTAGANIYFSVNELDKTAWNTKAKKLYVTRVTALQVDLDDLSEDALQKLINFSPKPSIILCSGGGYQAFWLLAQQGDCKNSAFNGVEAINKSIAKIVGGDNCHNIDRIMRLPGTKNHPNAKKQKAGRTATLAYLLEEHTDFSRVYTLDDFAAVPKESSNGQAVSALNIPKDIALVALADLNIPEADNPRTSAKPSYPSRSEGVFAVACGLARAGHSVEQTAGILLNSLYGISESILEKPNPTEYAYRQAEKALVVILENWPDTYKNGHPMRSYRNALYGLLRMQIVFEHDDFHNRKRIGGHQLQSFQGDLTDDACAVLRKVFVDEFEFDPGKGNILDAVQALCLENTVHPVREYLDSLAWDGFRRIDTWLTTYMEAEWTCRGFVPPPVLV